MTAIRVRVTPRAGRDEVVGWRDGELSVRVGAAPDGGKANAAVCAVLAHALKVPKTSVRVTRGAAARHKTIEVDHVTPDDVAAALGSPDAPTH